MLTNLNHLLPRDTIHAVITRAGPNFALAHDKEIAGIGGVYESMHIQHQRFIRSGFFRCNTSKNAI